LSTTGLSATQGREFKNVASKIAQTTRNKREEGYKSFWKNLGNIAKRTS